MTQLRAVPFHFFMFTVSTISIHKQKKHPVVSSVVVVVVFFVVVKKMSEKIFWWTEALGGGMVGGLVGLVPAVFTFGLSIPIGAPWGLGRTPEMMGEFWAELRSVST